MIFPKRRFASPAALVTDWRDGARSRASRTRGPKRSLGTRAYEPTRTPPAWRGGYLLWSSVSSGSQAPLGTPAAKLCFAAPPPAFVQQGAKRSFADAGSQAELGNQRAWEPESLGTRELG